MTKQRGIIMSAPMVLANLAKIKTETRRLTGLKLINENLNYTWTFEKTDSGYWFRSPGIKTLFLKCPYGKPGDVLYQRETHYYNSTYDAFWSADDEMVDFEDVEKHYPILDEAGPNPVPAIFMPKCLSRSWFEIVDIKVERLHDITPEAAIAEGIEIFRDEKMPGTYAIPLKIGIGRFRTSDPVHAYLAFVNMLNGLSMEANPFVWVVQYKHIEKPKGVN